MEKIKKKDIIIFESTVYPGLTNNFCIPILEKYVVKSKNHIVTGDHEDIKKDLKSHENNN